MFLLEIIAAFYTFLNQEPAKELDLRRRAIVPDKAPGVDASPLALIALYNLPDLNLLVTQSISRGQWRSYGEFVRCM